MLGRSRRVQWSGMDPEDRQIRPSAIRSQLVSNLVQSITKRGSNQRKEMAIGKAIRLRNMHKRTHATASTLPPKSQSSSIGDRFSGRRTEIVHSRNFWVYIVCPSVWSSAERHLCGGIVMGSTPQFRSPSRKDSISTYICLFSTLQPCRGS
jgi:hypothetical protein